MTYPCPNCAWTPDCGTQHSVYCPKSEGEFMQRGQLIKLAPKKGGQDGN